MSKKNERNDKKKEQAKEPDKNLQGPVELPQPVGTYGFRGYKVRAVYTPTGEHNPLIDALRQTPVDLAVKRMQRKPAYNEGDRQLDATARADRVIGLRRLMVTMGSTIDLFFRIMRLLVDGYRDRNPLDALSIRRMREAFEELEEADEYYLPLSRLSCGGLAIIGPSGVGKTTALESILLLIPQVIEHAVYEGVSFACRQLVWLKVDCPSEISLKALVLSIFREIDDIMGTSYHRQYHRRTQDELVLDLVKVASAVKLGLLIVDETQRLDAARSGGDQRLMNAFLQLSNTLGLPVVLAGTLRALGLFKEFANARRASSQGDVIWSPLAPGPAWDHFVEHFWPYQWTRVSTPLTPELKRALHEESAGILDLAIKVYMVTQYLLIGQEDEVITPDVIHEAAEEYLRLTRPVIRAYQNKGLHALAALDRLDVDAVVERAYRDVQNRTDNSGTPNAEKQLDEHLLPYRSIATALVEKGYNSSIAFACARQALRQAPDISDLETLIKEGLRLADTETKSRNTSKNKKGKKLSKSGDWRDITAKASGNLDAYELLKRVGAIKDMMEFFPEEARAC